MAPRTTIYIPDELANQLKALEGINVSAVCQQALTKELQHMTTVAELKGDMEKITIELEDHDVTFTGRALTEPTIEPGESPWEGVVYTVYLTAKGKIAVVHIADGPEDDVDVFDNVDQLDSWSLDGYDGNAPVPPRVYVAAKAALGERVTVELDI